METKIGVDRLHKREDDRERREEDQVILDWLTPIDFYPQQNDLISHRQEGTGQWLLMSSKSQEWVTHNEATLLCPGIPGAGKTMLTSIVVDHLWSTFQNDPTVGIAFFYCDFRRQNEQKPIDLLLSLLKQFVQKRLSVPENVKSVYEHHKSNRSRPSLEEVSKVLCYVINDYSRSFVIVDALDECQVADGSRKSLLPEIFNLQAQSRVCIFATSRFIPDITDQFRNCATLEIRARDEDVRRYLEGHIGQLSACVLHSPTLQEDIKADIIKAADGMYVSSFTPPDSLS